MNELQGNTLLQSLIGLCIIATFEMATLTKEIHQDLNSIIKLFLHMLLCCVRGMQAGEKCEYL